MKFTLLVFAAFLALNASGHPSSDSAVEQSTEESECTTNVTTTSTEPDVTTTTTKPDVTTTSTEPNTTTTTTNPDVTTTCTESDITTTTTKPNVTTSCTEADVTTTTTKPNVTTSCTEADVTTTTTKPNVTTSCTEADVTTTCTKPDVTTTTTANNTERMMWACDDTMTTPILNSYRVAGSLLTEELRGLFAAHCALAGNHLWPADATDDVMKNNTFDFIVVGAGSAGSVVANRLSENPEWRILLIEAGGNPTVATELPQLFFNNMNTENDWAYRTEPQEGACLGYKTKSCAMPRGKTLGGCSSTNAMYYVRGNKIDYDEWAKSIGDEEWGYEAVLPYFMKSENLSQYTTEHEKYHGTDGYLTVENNPNLSDYENLVIEGGVELGLKNKTDINGADQMGIVKSYMTTRNGVRCSTARAFLSPIKYRKNLKVLKNAYATKVVLESGTNVTKGVLLNHNGKEILVEATKEVIVSSGAINSAHLLLLSGIGPQEHLEEFDIEVKADLPVGENLQDHLFVPIFYTAPDANPLLGSNITEMFAQYMLKHEGLLADVAPHRVISFYNTTDSNATSPDIQNHHLIFSAGVTKMLNMFDKHQLSDEIQQKFVDMNKDKMIIMVCTVLLKPESRGIIKLKSNNPMDNPKIYANFFNETNDMKTIIRGLKQISLKLGDTNTFKEAGFELEWIDMDACKNYEKQSDDHLKCIASQLTFSLYHPVGTAKMGEINDDTAVVDTQLRVRKVEKLRVIDASIMPSIVRGNTNAASIMIGEKGADMIIKYWLGQPNCTDLPDNGK